MKPQEYYRKKYWNQLRLTVSSLQNEKHTKRLVDLLSSYLPQTASLIDIGCGDGTYYGHYFGNRTGLNIGADISLSALQRTRHLNLQRVVLDIEQPLPLHPASLGGALCIDVLEHLFDPESLMEEIFRILKPGSYLVVSVPNIAHFPHRLRLLGGKFVAGGLASTADTPWRDPHIRFFTTRSLRDFLSSTGFRTVKIYGVRTALLTRMPFLSVLIARIFGKKFLNKISEFFEPLGHWWPSLMAGKLIAVGQRPKE